ncbi:type III PLP-dependent enzyme [Kineococcus sp. NUM-3379]
MPAVPAAGTAPALRSSDDVHERIRRFLDSAPVRTPCLAVDLAAVRGAYREVAAAFAGAGIFYAVKANPAPQVVAALAGLGCAFDVASPAEIDLCLAQGAAPASLSYGNPVKKAADVAHAFARGVRTFTTDSAPDVENLAAHAPGSAVLCRIQVPGAGSLYPFGDKFGCDPDTAVELLRTAARRGLVAAGVAFHPGSQQLDAAGWDAGIAAAADVARRLRAEGVDLPVLNIGGGLPVAYREDVPPPAACARAVADSLHRHFGSRPPRLVLEPGRALVARAGVLRSEVVLVTHRSTGGGRRWVYLDAGRYGGLAETEGEAVTYPLLTSRDGGPTGDVVLAGPTCDADDVLYRDAGYRLPLDLRAGDVVDLVAAGAYTASYSSVGFNGFAPLETVCIDSD